MNAKESSFLLSNTTGPSNKIPANLDSEKFSVWKIKRQTTLTVFVVQVFLFAIDYTIILPTLWFYLTEVNAPDANLFMQSCLECPFLEL